MAEKVRGMVKPGNIDTSARTPIDNHDGTSSTVDSMSFNDGDHEVLIPKAWGDESDKVYSDDDAIDRYKATGEHLGWFDKPDAATKFAIDLHNSEAAKAPLRQAYPDTVKFQPPPADRRAAETVVERPSRPEWHGIHKPDDANGTRARNDAPAGDDVVTALARRVAALLPQQSALQKAQNDARVQQAKIAVEQFAAPKALAMRQYVPGAQAAADAMNAAESTGPTVRQPIQQSREFPSNPAGQADQDAYITRVRQAMKNAVAAKPSDGAAPRVPRSAEVQTPKSISYDTDPGMSGPRATQHDKVREAASSLLPSGGYAKAEKPEDIDAREAEHLARWKASIKQ